jgi:NADH dehydrogenase
MSTDDPPCDVLILGASFAGVELYYQLRRSRAGRKLQVTIVDRQAAHGYIPLCQERLVERLPLDRSALPTARCVVGDPRARYVLGEVVGFDAERREATLASGERLRGRFVVVALGSVLAPPPALPGHEHLLGYKFAEEFDASHARLAALLGDRPQGEPGPRLVVIGGGVSGVELAGELAHLARARPAGWAAPRVTLVDGGERLLRGLCARAGRQSERQLKAQGVELRMSTRVLRVDADGLELQTGGGASERLPCAASFWAGGVRPAPVLMQLGLPRTGSGYLAVGPTLQCFPTVEPTYPEIFACGDAVRVVGGTGEWPTMQRAIECLWQAKVVAHNVLALAALGPDAPRGRAVLRPHRLRADFPYGVSIGARSLIAFGPLSVDLGGLGVWFRRFLMRQYFARYGARRAGADRVSSV